MNLVLHHQLHQLVVLETSPFLLCGSGGVLKASCFGIVLDGRFPALLDEHPEVLDATPTCVRPQERRRVALMR